MIYNLSYIVKAMHVVGKYSVSSYLNLSYHSFNAALGVPNFTMRSRSCRASGILFRRILISALFI